MVYFLKKPLAKSVLSCGPLLLLLTAPADAGSALLEEITVVAQKREQNLQDVGISVSAFSGTQMKELGWSSSEDVAAQTPGLTASKTAGAAISQFNIRGIGQSDFADHHEAPNSIYSDEAYVASPGAAGFPMFDLERVEILRGPQGTLFGRNATGGLVHFISNKPSEEFNANVKATVGEFSQVRLEGAVGGALSDSIRGRFAAFYEEADGYIENDIGPDLREQGLFAARTMLQFDLSDKATLLVKVQGFSEDIDAGIYKSKPSYTDANGVNQFVPADLDVYGGGAGTDFYGYRDADGDPLSVKADQIGFIKKDIYGTTWNFSYEFDYFTLVAVTDYADVDTAYREDTDSGPFNQTIYNSEQDTSQFSQEIRISGESDKLNWVTGAYYLDISGDYLASFDLPTLAGFFDPVSFPGDGSGTGRGTGAAANSNWTLETSSWAVFAQGEWMLSEKLSLTLGARWTEDSKDYKLLSGCSEEAVGACAFDGFASVGDVFVDGVNLGPAAADIPGVIKLDRDDSDWSGKVQLDYRPNDDTLIYISTSKGIKGGGFTTPLDGLLAPSQLPYKPEKLFAYEMGGKISFPFGRLNTSVFYYDYKDFQTFEFRGITSVVLNQDAKMKGAEIELVLNPLEGLDVLLGAAYLDADVENILTPSGPKDQEPINAPEMKYNWLVRYSLPMGDLEWSFQYDGNWTDDRYFNIVNSPTVLSESYALHNLKVGLGDNEGVWDISVFVRNLSDEEYVSHTFDLTVLGYTIQKYGSPRWAGVNFSYNF